MVETLVEFQITIYAILMLLFLYFIMRVRTELDTHAMVLLRLIVLANIVNLIVDPVTNIVNEGSFYGAFFLNEFFTFVLFFIGTILAGLWVSYIDYKLFHSRSRLKKRFYYMHATVFMITLLLINTWIYPILYSIDPISNGYVRGPLRLVYHYVIYGLFFYTIILAYINKEKGQSIYIKVVILVFTIPILGSLVDLVIDEANFGWATMALGVLVAYIFLETTSGERDYLTQLFSRQSFEHYLYDLEAYDKNFGLLMIDLNDFKSINDTEGHQVGDFVLYEFAKTLQKVFSKEKMVARYAGDEFIVVLHNYNEKDIPKLMLNLKQLLIAHRDKHLQSLKFSYGFKRYDHENLKELFFEVDKAMYEQKDY